VADSLLCFHALTGRRCLHRGDLEVVKGETEMTRKQVRQMKAFAAEVKKLEKLKVKK
jgi:hypothetical protein